MKRKIVVGIFFASTAIVTPASADHDCKVVAWHLGKQAQKMQIDGVTSKEVPAPHLCSSGSHPASYISCINKRVSKKTKGAYTVVEENSGVFLKLVQ